MKIKRKSSRRRTAAKRKANRTVFVAVVVKPGCLYSGRTKGDYAAFLAPEESTAITRAMQASLEWSAKYGLYEVWAGKLLSKVEFPSKFRAVPLKPERT